MLKVENQIAVFTTIHILNRIKKESGLEMMLEYMENYERRTPEPIRKAISGAPVNIQAIVEQNRE